MTKDNEYSVWIAEGGRIRNSARDIVVNRDRTQILLENNVGMDVSYFNFIGGGVAVGETLTECIQRELAEETHAAVAEVEYLFVVENFFSSGGEIRHGLEHYFEVMLDQTEVMPTHSEVVYQWMAIDGLDRIDLRPAIVRDRIIAGTYRNLRHLVSTQHGT